MDLGCFVCHFFIHLSSFFLRLAWLCPDLHGLPPLFLLSPRGGFALPFRIPHSAIRIRPRVFTISLPNTPPHPRLPRGGLGAPWYHPSPTQIRHRLHYPHDHHRQEGWEMRLFLEGPGETLREDVSARGSPKIYTTTGVRAGPSSALNGRARQVQKSGRL